MCARTPHPSRPHSRTRPRPLPILCLCACACARSRHPISAPAPIFLPRSIVARAQQRTKGLLIAPSRRDIIITTSPSSISTPPAPALSACRSSRLDGSSVPALASWAVSACLPTRILHHDASKTASAYRPRPRHLTSPLLSASSQPFPAYRAQPAGLAWSSIGHRLLLVQVELRVERVPDIYHLPAAINTARSLLHFTPNSHPALFPLTTSASS